MKLKTYKVLSDCIIKKGTVFTSTGFSAKFADGIYFLADDINGVRYHGAIWINVLNCAEVKNGKL